jgi:hypothetical protein
VCSFDVGDLPEISGLTPSLRHRGILWAVNDSGNAPVLYALDTRRCRVEARHALTWDLEDPEALASSLDSRGRPVLWVGDIGDNASSRDFVQVIRIPEPDLGPGSSRGRGMRIRYPDGAHDAESLTASPTGRRLYLGTKRFGAGSIYRVRARGSSRTAVRVGPIPGLATDAARNPRSGGFAVRDYMQVIRYGRPTPPLHKVGTSPAPALPQAEALAFSRNGRWLFTASERDPRLFRARVVN